MSSCTDDELREAVLAFLDTREDWSDISTNQVREALRSDRGWALETKNDKVVIREAVGQWLDSAHLEDNGTEEVAEDEDEEHDEAQATSKAKGRGSGFNAPVQLSSALAEFMGVLQMPRAQVTKRIWEYIKAESLQNPHDKREILCQKRLVPLFGSRKSINMFKMTAALSTHMKSMADLTPASTRPTTASKSGKTAKKVGAKKTGKGLAKASVKTKTAGKSGEKATKPKSKPRREAEGGSGHAHGGGLQAPQRLSPELADLLGTHVLARTQVVKKLHEYFNAKGCKVPEDRRRILLDDKLKKIFPGEEVNMFSMNKHLSAHLSPLSADA